MVYYTAYNIDVIYKKLHKYIVQVDSEVYTDNTTGVRNKPAYKKGSKSLMTR